MKELINKKIENIYVTESELLFETEDSFIKYHVNADCCSNSYYSEIMHPDSILKHVVTSIEELEEECGEPTIQNSDTLYGYKISSDKQEGLSNCIITFRNSSNGYYGGSQSLSGIYEKKDFGEIKDCTHVKENYIADWRAF